MSRQLQKEGMRLALDEEENDETCDKRSQSKTPEAESSTAPKTSLSPKSPTVFSLMKHLLLIVALK